MKIIFKANITYLQVTGAMTADDAIDVNVIFKWKFFLRSLISFFMNFYFISLGVLTIVRVFNFSFGLRMKITLSAANLLKVG